MPEAGFGAAGALTFLGVVVPEVGVDDAGGTWVRATAGTAAGGADICDGGAAAAGLEPPIFSEIVGGGRGASVCSGRSMGAGGGCAGACPG